jgi:D-beta-D-heptose 7-phosphate kinase/D-beta-D-heptose 1-phosphate adenosyltransferase
MSVVFTNGCFDLFHAGHVSLLRYAKAQGDWLVVGLNSDASVRYLKGDKRPIIKQAERKLILEACVHVDEVFIFEEDTPLKLIGEIQPDILVKGADWQGKQVVGAELVKEVRFAPLTHCTDSTSSIIGYIKEKYGHWCCDKCYHWHSDKGVCVEGRE